MHRRKVLLVDDDVSLNEELQPEFQALNCQLDYAADGLIGLEMALTGTYDLILLDIDLPSLEGVEICKRVRKVLDTPIIMLSQRADELSKVLLLEIGADDYITKPYATRELKARFKALMRRLERLDRPSSAESVLAYKDLQIDFTKRTVTLKGAVVELTASEFDILALLASSPGKAFGRDELLELLYGFDASHYSRSITNHINRIRSKLESNPNNPVYVLTVRGHGYRFANIDGEEQ